MRKPQKITFLGNVETINYSLALCDSLKEIEFKGKVDEIAVSTTDSMSLMYCDKLERIIFREYVGAIGLSEFNNWGGGYSFDHSSGVSDLPSLKEVIFEKDVGTIAGLSFAACPKLEKVSFGGDLGQIVAPSFGGSDLLADGFDVLPDNTYLVKDESTGLVYNTEKPVSTNSPPGTTTEL